MKLTLFHYGLLFLFISIMSCKKDDDPVVIVEPDKDLQCTNTEVKITNKIVRLDTIILEWSKIEGTKEYEVTLDQKVPNPKIQKTSDSKIVLIGLTNDSEYIITIQSICASGKYSTKKTIETIRTLKSCEQKVSNYKVETLKDNEVTLSWTKLPQVDFYLVQLFDADNGGYIGNVQANENKATFSDLPSGKNFIAEIKSGCGSGGQISVLSTRIEFKTKEKILNEVISSTTVPCALLGCEAMYADNLLGLVSKGPVIGTIPITPFLDQECNGYYFKFYNVKDSSNYSDFVIYSKKNADGNYSTYYKMADCDKYKNYPQLINGSIKHNFNQETFYTVEIVGKKVRIYQSINCNSRYKIIKN